ncbi:MAG: Do family serine endopeptidase [Tangfeifania sp.]
MKNTGKYAFSFLLVAAGAFLAVWLYSSFFNETEVVTIKEEYPVKYANLVADGEANMPDLTFAAEKSVHAVVHIATQSIRGGGWSSGNPFFDEFFGLRRNQEPQLSTGYGSGVIISDDGYIVTNNHVIERAQKIKVILNDKREFEARLIGTDSSTDIALLKIETEDLAYLTYGDSDKLKLGEWVLAVGNPFNLTSTVTAGIVSARARNLGINEDQYSIESFIQTDAAVNPGNSGGALVNQQGNLVGINTAIASRTGSYAGYSFAVPISIVGKVVEDLKEFGEVQRALLGVNIGDVTAAIAEEYDLGALEGVYVGGVTENGAAREAGIKEGDVIISVEGQRVNSSAELQEKVSRYRPGDDVKIVVKRNGDRKQFNVTLRNRHGDTQIVRDNVTVLGAMFETVSLDEMRNLDIENGIKITKLNSGKLKDAGLEEGFIITHVNKKPIFEVNDFKREIGNARGGILVEGIYPNGELAYFVFGVDQ